MRRWLTRAVYGLVQRGWAAGFWVAGRLRPPTVQPWSSSGGQRVLVVAPHPDDETIGCGGTLIRHSRAGDEVWVVVVTDGRQSRAGGLAAAEMAARRQQEAQEAAGLLGLAQLVWLGLPEGEWQVAELLAALRLLLADFRPHLLYAPSRIDFHPEHHRVAHGLALALDHAASELPQVRIYPIQTPLTPLLANLISDTSAVAAQVQAAVRAYRTQAIALRPAGRSHHYNARFYGFARTAEEFWTLPAAAYVALHRDRPETWRDPFRGLRGRPLSDPLAYLTGRSTRRAYRSAVAHKFSPSSK